MLHCRDNREKKKGDNSKQSLSLLRSRRSSLFPFFASPLLIIQSARYPLRYHCLPRAPVRVGRTHERSATMKTDRRAALVGHLGWCHLVRRARNREMPTSLLRYSALLHFLSFIFCSLFSFYSLLPRLSPVEFALRSFEREVASCLPSSLSSSYVHRTHRRRQSCADVRVSVTKRSETPFTRHM